MLCERVLRNACDIDTLHEDVVMRDFYMKDVGKCAKIFVPVNHGFCHWYLLIIFIPEMRAEIWDPNPSTLTSKMFNSEAKTILRSLDKILNGDARKVLAAGTKFEHFTILQVIEFAVIPESYNYGVLILLMMQRGGKWLQNPTFQCDFDTERSQLVLQLLTSIVNSIKEKVMEKSRDYNMANKITSELMCAAVENKYLKNLRKSRKMGHGRRK